MHIGASLSQFSYYVRKFSGCRIVQGCRLTKVTMIQINAMFDSG
jgi:hypothetical protein